MRKILKILALTLIALTVLSVSALCAPALISESAVLIDADTGQVLYNKDMHAKRYPASITKIATVICGLEKLELSDKIVMSYDAVFSVSRDASHIALDTDEELSVEDAAHAALLMSANEACNGIAELASGSIDAFVDDMNELAVRAGAKGTHFANANGLRDSDHYTTAYDMAMICRYALKNEDFKRIFGTYKYTMAPTNKQPEQRLFVNQHEMISVPNMRYDGIVGGKAGWTQDAQYTLVTAAERDGRTLIAVVMKSPQNNNKYTDTKALFDYGFENFELLTLENFDIPKGDYSIEAPISLTVPKGTSKSDLSFLRVSEPDGEYLRISLNDGTELGTFPCESEVSAANVPPIEEEEPEKKRIHPILLLGLVLLSIIGLFALFILGIIIRKEIYRARRRRRRRRRMGK